MILTARGSNNSLLSENGMQWAWSDCVRTFLKVKVRASGSSCSIAATAEIFMGLDTVTKRIPFRAILSICWRVVVAGEWHYLAVFLPKKQRKTLHLLMGASPIISSRHSLDKPLKHW